eukprot:SAG11_NODE_1796_length_4247_cov_5.498795_2_plen_176_part_00
MVTAYSLLVRSTGTTVLVPVLVLNLVINFIRVLLDPTVKIPSFKTKTSNKDILHRYPAQVVLLTVLETTCTAVLYGRLLIKILLLPTSSSISRYLLGYSIYWRKIGRGNFFQVPTVGFTTFEYTYKDMPVSGLYCMCTPENRVHTKISRKKFPKILHPAGGGTILWNNGISIILP